MKWNKQQATYKKRDETLLGLGFSSYQEYIASPMWQAIKRQILTDEPLCRLCHNDASCVHHIGYGKHTLLGLNPTALVPLCKGCHWLIEFDKEGSKRTLKESERVFRKLWRVCPFRKRKKPPKG